MTTNERRDLLACLAEVDELYAKQEPDPSLQARVLGKLGAPLKKRTRRAVLFGSLWAVRRPLGFAFAIGSVFWLSMMEQGDAPAPKQSLVAPQASEDASHSPFAPLRDRTDEASPSRRSRPVRSEVPTTEPSKSVSPRLQEPSFRDLETEDADPLHGYGGRAPLLFFTPSPFESPWSQNKNEAYPEAILFWPPSMGVSSEPSSPSLSSLGEERASGQASAFKPPRNRDANPPMLVCLDTGALSEQAQRACEKEGLVASELVFLEPCGDKLFRTENHTCVEPEAEDEACITQKLGDGSKCLDPSNLKQLAFESCLAAGLDLIDLTFDPSECGDKPLFATYTCCPKNPEPPTGDSVCKSSSIGDGVNCLEVDVLKKDAMTACSMGGMSLVEFFPTGDCPVGKGVAAKFVCCTE